MCLQSNITVTTTQLVCNDKGSWRCFCNQGYEGNGTFCQGKDSLVNVFMRNRIKK